MGLELMTDRYPLITSQTCNPLCHDREERASKTSIQESLIILHTFIYITIIFSQ